MSITIPDEQNQHAADKTDSDLIRAVRAGSTEAYGELYKRHRHAAYRMARHATQSHDADDLVSEAFRRVLETLQEGGGPTEAFLPYLQKVVCRTAIDRARRDKRLQLEPDMATLPLESDTPTDPVIEKLETSLAAQAFAQLPERWRMVLWHTVIEGQTPKQLAPLLGMTPNAVSAIAVRAREALKRKYLQCHLAEHADAQCRPIVELLGAATRGGLSRRDNTHVTAHLKTCQRCRTLRAELDDVNKTLRTIVAPIVLGTSLAAGYTAAGHAGTAAAASGKAAILRKTLTGAAAVAAAAVVIAFLPQGPRPPEAQADPPETTTPHPLPPLPPTAPPTPPTGPSAQTLAATAAATAAAEVHVDQVIDAGTGLADNRIVFTVTNVTDRPGIGKATVTLPNGVHAGRAEPGCDYTPPSYRPNMSGCARYLNVQGCDYWAYDLRHLTCQQWLNPGESYTRTIWLGATPDALLTDPNTSRDFIRLIAIPVTAQVNDYQRTTDAYTRLWYPWQPLARPVQGTKNTVTGPLSSIQPNPAPRKARPSTDLSRVASTLH